MVKYLIIGFILLVSPAVMSASKPHTNYDKIISEWSSSVLKQRHNIGDSVFEKKSPKKKSAYALLLQRWGAEVKKLKYFQKRPSEWQFWNSTCNLDELDKVLKKLEKHLEKGN